MNKQTLPPGSALNRWAGYTLVAIAVLHTAAFAFHPYWSDWLTGDLQTGKAPGESVVIFWALPGSFVPMMILFGLLVVRLAKRGKHIPGYTGWVLAAWSVVCVFLLGPSGFMLISVPAALLVIGNLKGRKAVGPAHP